MDFALEGVDTRTLSERGAEMVVRRVDTNRPLLDKDGQPVVLVLLGPDSPKYRALQREQVRKRLERAAANRGRPTDVADPEEDQRDATEMLVQLTVGWRGVNTPDGEPIPCHPETVRSLFDRYPAIRDQADAFVTERRNFTTGSSGP